MDFFFIFLFFFYGFFSSFFPLIDGSRLMASLMDTNQWRWGIRLYRVIHCNPIGFFFHFHFHLHFHLRSEIKSLHSSFQIALQPIVCLVKMFKINWKCSRKKSIFDCGFCSNRILHYFPLFVRPSITGMTSHISHIYKSINATLIIRGPIKPYIFWIKIILAIFLY